MSEVGSFRNEGVCSDCPSRYMPKGEYNVAAAGKGLYRRTDDEYKTDSTGAPTCIHPTKIDLPEGNYISKSDVEPSFQPDTFPATPEELVDLIAECVATVDPLQLELTLQEIENMANSRGFSDEDVTECLRNGMIQALHSVK